MRAVEDAVRHGTTALEARSGFPLSEAGEMKVLRVHAALQKRCAPVAVVSTMLCARAAPGFEERADEYLDWARTHLLPSAKRRKLAAFAAIRCGEEGFRAEQAERYLSAARELKFGLRLEVGQGSGSAAIQLGAELNVSSVDNIGDPSEQDLARLAQSSSIATVLPGAEFHLGTRHYVCARRLIDGGVAVALASGYHPERCPSLNMQMIVALACSGMQMTPGEGIAAATINAAHALGLASRIGSLEAGKSADLLVLSVSDYREIPYRFGVNLVDLVMVGGEILMRRSEVQWPAN